MRQPRSFSVGQGHPAKVAVDMARQRRSTRVASGRVRMALRFAECTVAAQTLFVLALELAFGEQVSLDLHDFDHLAARRAHPEHGAVVAEVKVERVGVSKLILLEKAKIARRFTRTGHPTASPLLW